MMFKNVSFAMFLVCALIVLSISTFESPSIIAALFLAVMGIIAFHAYYILRYAGTQAEKKPAEIESPNKEWYEKY